MPVPDACSETTACDAAGTGRRRSERPDLDRNRLDLRSHRGHVARNDAVRARCVQVPNRGRLSYRHRSFSAECRRSGLRRGPVTRRSAAGLERAQRVLQANGNSGQFGGRLLEILGTPVGLIGHRADTQHGLVDLFGATGLL